MTARLTREPLRFDNNGFVRLRDYRPGDLDDIFRLWDSIRADEEPVFGISEVISSCQEDYAVVAVNEERVIGVAVGRAAHALGWVVFVGTDPVWQNRGVGKKLIAALEQRMSSNGLQRLCALLPESASRLGAFVDQGFVAKKNLRYLERHLPVQLSELRTLHELGGRSSPVEWCNEHSSRMSLATQST